MFMKNFLKTTGIIAALSLIVFAAASAAGCRSTGSGRKIAGDVPEFVSDAVNSAPKNALVGIGTAKLSTANMSRTVAQSRARANISLQMNSMVQYMVRKHNSLNSAETSAVKPLAEKITVTVSESKLPGAKTVIENTDRNGNYWAVVYLSRENTISEITQAQAVAKLSAPGFVSFNTNTYINEAYNVTVSKEIVITGK